MPGLLQTAAYARAVISTVGLYATPKEIEAKVAARMARQLRQLIEATTQLPGHRE